jgi:hypothetical protein
MPLGGGVMASGLKMESVIEADHWRLEIQALQARFEEEAEELMPTFRQRGYAAGDEIRGRLRITETGYQVIFPQYGVVVNLKT